MGFDHFKRGYWNDIQEQNKKLMRKNGLQNRLGIIDFKFNSFLVSKDILLTRDLITQELIDEFKTGRQIKSMKSETPVPEEFEDLKRETEDLKVQFDSKQQKAREIIEKRFPSPQLTNDKFNSIVDASSRNFSKRVNAIMIMIHSSDGYSARVDGQIKSNISVLKQIIEKLDLMTDELLISMVKSEDSDMENLLEEMEFLTDSIKNYD